ncbi:hypothetical protein [Nostoc sp. FACHB-110]|uniref:hypothetical protein n=1 Tax=Nostoc sp. FACHB-110 TaxID=2692834 RepID=UPI001685F351|nr:hypothetical protein [Nostoc sp. FACHB-110]MBD2437388.1 hypothetical protein [Nostoc sp. FACHB-110]
MNREELGIIVRRVWVRWAKKQENPKASWLISWDELEEHYKEVDRQIGESVQKAVLEQFKGQLVSFEEDGVRVLGDSNQIPSLLKLIDKHQPDYSFERPHILNLSWSVQTAIDGYRNSETRALSKLKSFKEDVLTYLRAIALMATIVGNAATHAEKAARLRGLIELIESSIQTIRNEQEKFIFNHWDKPDLFKSDYPLRRYIERIRELEVENKKLKGEPLSAEDEEYGGMF